MNVQEILAQIATKRVLVIGDICLDRWCYYDPSLAEPSRETSIPRVGVVSYDVTPGAGGTVANNLVAMGVREVSVLGIQGDDGAAYELGKALAHRGIDSRWMVTDPTVQTFTYTKYLNITNHEEDLPRTDFVNVTAWDPKTEQAVLDNLRAAAPSADVILVSDQAETQLGGVISAAVREELASIGRQSPEKVIWVDSRVHAEDFRDVIVKMNEEEGLASSSRLVGSVDFQALRAHVSAPVLMVTFGGDGVEVVRPDGKERIHTKPIENPVDICGAGDSFSAGAAMALSATKDPVVAARFGNAVASVTIMKKGTGTASPEEILAAVEQLVS